MSNSEAVKQLFNEWAIEGRDMSMEDGHKHAVREALREVNVPQEAHMLDVGCGNGYVARALANRVPEGTAMGVDLSDEMIALAKDLTPDEMFNVIFYCGSIFDEGMNDERFDLVFGMESIYYITPVADAIKRLVELLASGGQLVLVMDFYKENEECHDWPSKYNVEMELLSTEDYINAFTEAGLEDVFYRQITYPEGSTEEAWKVEKGSLMVSGFKPFDPNADKDDDEEDQLSEADGEDQSGAPTFTEEDRNPELPENPLDIFGS